MKHEIGDKVRIVTKKIGEYWSPNGDMDKWLGEVMTIKGIRNYSNGDYYSMEEDQGTWSWFEWMVEGLASDRYEIHITCNDGKTTHAIYKKNGKVVNRAKALCSPEDEFDFTAGANLAYNRLMRPEMFSECAEDKPKYKVGDKVKSLGKRHEQLPRYYPPAGTIGTIVGVSLSGSALVQWPANSTSGDDCWANLFDDLEPYTEPEQESVKLYCVKNFPSYLGASVRAGDICTFLDSDGAVRLPSGNPAGCLIPERTYKDWAKDNPERAACLVPLVERPAKVGEWVYVVEDCKFSKGTLAKCVHEDPDNVHLFKNADGEDFYLATRRYLVLDGYQSEPEYLNMDVVCTSNKYGVSAHIPDTTIGKVYAVVDGAITDDVGWTSSRYKTLEALCCGIGTTFIPYKGKSK